MSEFTRSTGGDDDCAGRPGDQCRGAAAAPRSEMRRRSAAPNGGFTGHRRAGSRPLGQSRRTAGSRGRPPLAESATADGKAADKIGACGRGRSCDRGRSGACAARGGIRDAAELHSVPYLAAAATKGRASRRRYLVQGGGCRIALGIGWIAGANTFDRTEEVRRLAGQLDATQAKLADVAKAARIGPEADLAALKTDLSALKKSVDGLGKALDTQRAGLGTTKASLDTARSDLDFDQNGAAGGASRPRRSEARYGQARSACRACRSPRAPGLRADADRLDPVPLRASGRGRAIIVRG